MFDFLVQRVKCPHCKDEVKSDKALCTSVSTCNVMPIRVDELNSLWRRTRFEAEQERKRKDLKKIQASSPVIEEKNEQSLDTA